MTRNCSESLLVLATSPWVVSAMRRNPPVGANNFKGVLKVSLNSKSTGLFSPSTTLGGGVFSTPLCKIRSRHPKGSKLTGLIAYIMFYKICKL